MDVLGKLTASLASDLRRAVKRAGQVCVQLWLLEAATLCAEFHTLKLHKPGILPEVKDVVIIRPKVSRSSSDPPARAGFQFILRALWSCTKGTLCTENRFSKGKCHQNLRQTYTHGKRMFRAVEVAKRTECKSFVFSVMGSKRKDRLVLMAKDSVGILRYHFRCAYHNILRLKVSAIGLNYRGDWLGQCAKFFVIIAKNIILNVADLIFRQTHLIRAQIIPAT